MTRATKPLSVGTRVSYRLWTNNAWQSGTIVRYYGGESGRDYVTIKRDGYRETTSMSASKAASREYLAPYVRLSGRADKAMSYARGKRFTVTRNGDTVTMRHRDSELVITAIVDSDSAITHATVVELDGGGIYPCPMWQGSLTAGLIRFINYYTSDNN